MAKYKILFDRQRCVAGADCGMGCVLDAPEFWSYTEDGKVSLASAKRNTETGLWELPIGERFYWENQMVAENCPSGAINIVRADNVPKRSAAHRHQNIGMPV